MANPHMEGSGDVFGGSRAEVADHDVVLEDSPPEDPDRGFRAVRRYLRGRKPLNFFYRGAVGTVGLGVVVLGLLLVPLPGPGWLIVFAGLAILATEFEWAARLLRFARRKVQAWTSWVTHQSLAVRALIALVGLAVVAAAVWWYLQANGAPERWPRIG